MLFISRSTIFRLFALGLFTTSFLSVLPNVFAQSETSPQKSDTIKAVTAKSTALISLSHNPPKPQALPYPGQTLKLVVTLTGTKDTERKLRLLMVRDGNVTDIAAPGAQLNEYDQPRYEIPITAPVGEMSYQFLIYNPDGTALNSPRYAVRRTCIPSVDIAAGSVPPEVQGVERLQALVNEAKHLEAELANYDRIFALIDRIQALVNQ